MFNKNNSLTNKNSNRIFIENLRALDENAAGMKNIITR
jgi:hypothetical protein